jgi:hypothetical protein
MSAPSANKKLLEDILAEIKSIKKIQRDRQIKEDANSELLHLILQQLNDLSVKKDLEINMFSLKNDAEKAPKKKSTGHVKVSEGKKMNIMAYFKYKFTEDPESLYDIISKEEIENTLKAKESELKLKKKGNLDQAKASIIYKDLISGNKTRQARLRTKKEQEEELGIVLEEEIVENHDEEKHEIEHNNSDEDIYDDESSDED